MKHIYFFTVLSLMTSLSYCQIPVEKYRAEIVQLRSDSDQKEFWDILGKIDQEILVNTTDIRIADSISISNMIRTALIFEIHGVDAYTPNNHIPILNLSHNYIGKSQMAFWPIIELCAKTGGVIDSFGGKFPAYELESISLTFYNYSLFMQEEVYPELLHKMNQKSIENIVHKLEESYQYAKYLSKLREIEILNSWSLKSFKNKNDEGVFSFVRMSDNCLYLKKFGRIQKLELIKTEHSSKVYRIEDEPFGWNYIYESNGKLTLVDDDKKELIKYTIVK